MSNGAAPDTEAEAEGDVVLEAETEDVATPDGAPSTQDPTDSAEPDTETGDQDADLDGGQQ